MVPVISKHRLSLSSTRLTHARHKSYWDLSGCELPLNITHLFQHLPLGRQFLMDGIRLRDWNLDLLGMPKSLETIMLPALRVSVRVKWKGIFFSTPISVLCTTLLTIWKGLKALQLYTLLKYKMVKHPTQHQSHSQKQHNRNLCFYCWFKKIPNGIAENKMFQNSSFYFIFLPEPYWWYNGITDRPFFGWALLVCLFERLLHVSKTALELAV